MKNELELTDPILMEKVIDTEPIPGVKEVLESTGMKRPRVAILSEDGFEETELISPRNALESAGAKVDVISPKRGEIKGWNKTDWGKAIKVDINLQEANADDYDALVLPGGVMNPDKLRLNKGAVSFVKHFIRSGKTIAAICHGPQTLIETGMIAGVTMTSYPSLQTDLVNAGVDWVDREMVHYGQFITSRRPADLEAFNNELIHSLFSGTLT
jgi:protease I